MKPEAPGVLYWLEKTSPAGVITREGPYHNLVPYEGLNHLLNVALKGLTPVTSWFVGIYEGDYTPDTSVTAATLGGLATECTAYSESTRRPFVPGTVASGSVDNAASLAEFTFNAGKTVHGSFLTSASAKGATSGVLLSVVRFPSPQVMASGSKLSILAGPTAQPIV